MWQPIETAPKDETPILIDFGILGIHRVFWYTNNWCVEDNRNEPMPFRGYKDNSIRGGNHSLIQ